MSDTRSKFETSWSLMIVWSLSVLVAIASLRFLIAEISLVMPHMVHHAMARPVSLYLHIGFAPVALLLLPIQFSQKLRMRRPGLHRWAGRLYALMILLSGVSGLFLAITTEAGPVAALGFGMLAILWLTITARAVQLAMQRRIAEHRRWMIRSAALTLAAVTLRVYLPIGIPLLGFDAAYVIISWACWVPNLIMAELILRRRIVSQLA